MGARGEGVDEGAARLTGLEVVDGLVCSLALVVVGYDGGDVAAGGAVAGGGGHGGHFGVILKGKVYI